MVETAEQFDVLGIDAGGVLAQHGPFLLTQTAVIPMEHTVPYEVWEAAFHWCSAVQKASPFWVGDLLNYGEAHYGEKYSQAVQDTTGMSDDMLSKAAYVARKVEPKNRRSPDLLTFAHHTAVAAFTPDQQEHWLTQAEVHGWTAQELARRVRSHKLIAAGQTVRRLVTVEGFTDEDTQDQFAVAAKLQGYSVTVRVEPVETS